MGPLKGFRDDKVPLSMVINRVGGQEKFKAAILEDILLEAMEKVGQGGEVGGGGGGLQPDCMCLGGS